MNHGSTALKCVRRDTGQYVSVNARLHIEGGGWRGEGEREREDARSRVNPNDPPRERASCCWAAAAARISQHLEAALLHLQPRCDSQAEGGGEEGWFPLDVRRNLAPLTGVNRPPVAR